MHLLLNDQDLIIHMTDMCIKTKRGYKISDHVIIGDTTLTHVIVEDVPEYITPLRYFYKDGEFKQIKKWVDPITTEKQIQQLSENLDDLKLAVEGRDPNELNLEEYKIYLRQKNNDLLREFLKTHPLLWTDGKYYGVTEEDQNQILGAYNGWKIDQALGINSKLEWNAANEGCREWTEEELLALIASIYKYAKKMVKLYQIYKVQILNCTSRDEINSIVLEYSEEIADELIAKISSKEEQEIEKIEGTEF